MTNRTYELVWRFEWQGDGEPQRDQFFINWQNPPGTGNGAFRMGKALDDTMPSLGEVILRAAPEEKP